MRVLKLTVLLALLAGVAQAHADAPASSRDRPGSTPGGTTAGTQDEVARPGAPWPRVASTSPAISQRAMEYYVKRYGVDELHVRRVSSGSMLEFRYLVADVQKAKVLSDKKAPPQLIDEKTGIKVGVPFMENVGTLRQSAAPAQGREYWMVFENPSKVIQRGSRVDITIGSFHVAGLIVE